VTTGARDEAQGIVAITCGVRPGEQVLARPAPAIAEGTPVVLSGERARSTTTPAARAASGDADAGAPAER
jgi:hypothetical protein